MDIRAALRARIAALDRDLLQRRAGATAASVVAHVAVGALVVATLGAAREPEPRPATSQNAPMTMAFVDIDLTPEPEPRAAPEPPPERVLRPDPKPLPETPPPREPPPEPIQQPLPEPEAKPPPPQPEPRPEPPQPAAKAAPEPPPQPAPEPARQMASVNPPPLPAPPTPSPPEPRPPEKKAEPAKPEKPEPAKSEPGAEKIPAAPSIMAAAPSTPGDSVFLPPSVKLQPGGPAGLRGLMADPCETTIGPKPRECAGRELAARVGNMDSVIPRSKDELAQHFAEYMPKCTLKVGCEGGEWVSTNGTRSVAKAPPGSADDRGQAAAMAGGAASLGGLNSTVGRLGHNPDHTDPGFGD